MVSAMMWKDHSGMTTSGWWSAGIAMIVVWLVRRYTPRSKQLSPSVHRTAGDILDERDARGELTDEEYRHRRDLLHVR
jgi:uncharacterized membrane protein